MLTNIIHLIFLSILSHILSLFIIHITIIKNYWQLLLPLFLIIKNHTIHLKIYILYFAIKYLFILQNKYM